MMPDTTPLAEDQPMTVDGALLKYPGSKWRVAPWVLEHFPPHKIYVEAFAGSAAILMQKARVTTEILNDTNQDIVTFWRVLRDPKQLRELTRLLELTPYSRVEYFDAHDVYAADSYEALPPVERALNFLIRGTFANYSKGANKRSGFMARIDPSGGVRNESFWSSRPRILAQAGARLQRVILESCDALGIIRRHNRPDALIYLDPPYLLSTRTGVLYPNEMTDAQHRLMLREARASTASVLISGYSSRLYERHLEAYEWTRFEQAARIDRGAPRTECLWVSPLTMRRLNKNRKQPHLWEGDA